MRERERQKNKKRRGERHEKLKKERGSRNITCRWKKEEEYLRLLSHDLKSLKKKLIQWRF